MEMHANAYRHEVVVSVASGRTFCNQFKYDNLYILVEKLSEYSYLQNATKCNGNFNLAINAMVEEARKANFKMKNLFG